MKIKLIPGAFAVCRLNELPVPGAANDFWFAARTDEEISLVCRQERVPPDAAAVEHDWRALRIEGVLDFSLTGILAGITALLAARQIALFAISTYNTDYILVKSPQLDAALAALKEGGWEIA